MDAAVEVSNVTKSFRIYRERNQSLKATVLRGGRARFDEFQALKDVDFAIPTGSTFGLLGRNGSGKSTLLKCMAKILNPSSGSITTRGRVAAMLEVGSGFHPELSGRENVYLNGAILGMSKAEIDRKFDQIVDFSGVREFIDQPIKNYSSGMYVRLGFSVSIHIEPDILLVDEVLAVGDMEFQERCMSKFAQFREEGRTVVVVSHAIDQMRTFCDQAAWLDKGTLQSVGAAASIVDQYSDSGHAVEHLANGGSRYGSGELQVTDVQLLNAAGGRVDTVSTGDLATLRLQYRATEVVRDADLQVSIASNEGATVWSLRLSEVDSLPSVIEPGTGTIAVTLERVLLAPGSYDVSVLVTGQNGSHTFDSLQRTVSFAVLTGSPRVTAGVLAMPTTIAFEA